MEETESLGTVCGNVNQHSHCAKYRRGSSKQNTGTLRPSSSSTEYTSKRYKIIIFKSSRELSDHPAVLLSTRSKDIKSVSSRDICTPITHNSHNMETIQFSINRWKDKRKNLSPSLSLSLPHTHTQYATLFSLKQKGKPCYL